jgi:hypothetical protein
MPILVFLATLLLAVSSLSAPLDESPGQIWKVSGRRWGVEDEYRFAEWVEATITDDFFVRHKIPVDCADVPYAVRWIYARVAHLPALATTKDGKLVGHWSTNWKHLPTDDEWHRDRRFRAALFHMLSETTTRTLPLDTYPIRIDADSVTAGTAFFVTESHSGIIGHVSLDGSHAHPLQTWEATVPAKIQKMRQKNFLSPRPESTIYSGLVKFRWPVTLDGRWQQLPAKQHPFYSEEQYSSTFYDGYADFMEAVAKRIDPKEYDPWEKVLKVLDTTVRFARDRIPIVLEGYRRCQKKRCREGSELWEIYSTPGRDGFIILLMDHLKQLIESNDLDPEVVKEVMEAICLDISKDRSISFEQLYQNYLWLSPHPEDPIEARWGLRKCDMILARVRQANQSIRFTEKTYRKKDPKYADFSGQQQQEIIRRLWKDWDRFQCEDTEVSKRALRP